MSWLQAWHIRDETYSAGLAILVNTQLKHPFAKNWGEGKTSSSDGQEFKSGGHVKKRGIALREFGRIERTIFMLKWYIDPNFRRHVTAELNKGEARNGLTRAISFHRLGEIRDKNYEDQRFRASGLTLVTAAIVLWNTVYLDRIITAMKEHGHHVDENLLQYLSPLGWEHINLTGDYVWQQNKQPKNVEFRPLKI